VRQLPIGQAHVDLHVVRGKYGGSIEVRRKEGDVEVIETR